MEPTAVWERPVMPRGGLVAAEQSDYALSVTVVYQDGLTREWAMQVCARATNLVGPENVRSTWWKTRFLNHPRVFAEAVEATVLADVIIVAVWATRQVPRELSRWSERWLAQRSPKEGALLALVGRPDQATTHLSPILGYLRAVAERSHLDFLPDELKLPVEAPAPALEQTGHEAQIGPPLADPILRYTHASFWPHWGLNE